MPRHIAPILAPLILAAFSWAAPARAEDPGAYLAARVAGVNGDFREAGHWFRQALAADPENISFMEGAIVALICAGNIPPALEISRSLDAAGGEAQPMAMALIADQTKRGDFSGLLDDLRAGRSAGKLTDGLLLGWAELGSGQISEALEEFDKVIATRGLEIFGQYHKALALGSIGNFEAAEKILSGDGQQPVHAMRRGTLAHIQILSQLERNDDALEVLRDAFPNETDPTITTMIERLENGEMLEFDAARNATEGVAEVYFTLGVALNGEADESLILLYSRLASWLRPDHSDAMLLTAGMLENRDQFDLATEAYGTIAKDSDAWIPAQTGLARTLNKAEKADEAVQVLTNLAGSYPKVLAVHLSLGDTLRQSERWAEATGAYDAAIGLLKDPVPEPYWTVYYSRAITLERQKIWDRAEEDFRKALEMNPGQPQVLNYLGYSLLERRDRIEEAMTMIERAVAASPDSGYIVDSLAWGKFLLGQYDEAVEPMERASLLEPVDPIVTDHLGDIYWAVGRKMEARFQWRRALSFEPEEKDAVRIRRKLEIGLDAVLTEEDAPPLNSADDNQPRN